MRIYGVCNVYMVLIYMLMALCAGSLSLRMCDDPMSMITSVEVWTASWAAAARLVRWECVDDLTITQLNSVIC